MSSLSLILSRLANPSTGIASAELLSDLEWNHITLFFAAVSRLHTTIVLQAPQRNAHQLPHLTSPVRDLVSSAIHLPHTHIDALWSLLGDIALDAGPLNVINTSSLDCSMASAAPRLALGMSLIHWHWDGAFTNQIISPQVSRLWYPPLKHASQKGVKEQEKLWGERTSLTRACCSLVTAAFSQSPSARYTADVRSAI